MANRFPNVISQYVNVDGEQVPYSSFKGCRFDYQLSGYLYSTMTFSLTAVPGADYEFDHWEFSPEHPFSNIQSASLSKSETGTVADPLEPYRITVICYFKSRAPQPTGDSAIDLRLISSPSGVGSLMGGGIRSGAVGDSVTYTVLADLLPEMKGRYRFLYWLDDQGVKHKEKSFSKDFTFKEGFTRANPEVITFVAHFTQCTGLILRSPSSGVILRGRLNRILRDE